MPECFGYAEDALSCAVMRKLLYFRNTTCTGTVQIQFKQGFPLDKKGCGELRKIIPKAFTMANNCGLRTFILTDLDLTECSPTLLKEWCGTLSIPQQFLFRIAEKEVEAWLLADRQNLGAFLGIAASNFSPTPDSLPDPKQHLLNVIKSKGRKRIHRDMLPREHANVGPEYNAQLCTFVEKDWDIAIAAQHSASLQHAIHALTKW